MEKENKNAWLTIPFIILIAIGVAVAGSSGSLISSGIPIFATAVVLVFLIQWIAFVPAFIGQTEKFFDLTGSLTYISITLISVVLVGKADVRTFILLAMVIVWAARLGSFLFRRIHAAGEDRRFRDIKPSFPRFLMTWTLQGLWITLTLAAALAAITAEKKVAFDVFAVIGAVIWIMGFGFEVIADWQKSQFKTSPANKGKFIQGGLWSLSRHPNYFGEIVLWVGVALVAFPVLSGWQYLTLISPLFVAFLLTKVSGVPMLEKRADEKWGGQADYETYKAHTSVLIPMPARKK